MSAFTFPDAFRRHLDENGTTKAYAGPCGAAWLWFDIDADDKPERGLNESRRLAAFVADRYQSDGDELLLFFSGAKGFHIGLPLSLCGSTSPAAGFHGVCRKLAAGLAEAAGVGIDAGVYDAVRAFRAPNSRHPKSGLHKRRLSFDELLHLSLDGIRKLAAAPAPFDIPEPPPMVDRAATDWREAVEAVEREAAALADRKTNRDGSTVTRATLAFIRDGAANGDRHRLLYSAARNLAESGCSPSAVHALLSESALDSGLPPKDVRRQIDCGIADAGKGANP
ncbi:MAG: hypothetical protein IT428_03565 [Planctomycetaceae bacterium]|nr:hypothetical protein [Planctomycetaceae bacterium]